MISQGKGATGSGSLILPHPCNLQILLGCQGAHLLGWVDAGPPSCRLVLEEPWPVQH